MQNDKKGDEILPETTSKNQTNHSIRLKPMLIGLIFQHSTLKTRAPSFSLKDRNEVK